MDIADRDTWRAAMHLRDAIDAIGEGWWVPRENRAALRELRRVSEDVPAGGNEGCGSRGGANDQVAAWYLPLEAVPVASMGRSRQEPTGWPVPSWWGDVLPVA